jgi:hypothetical protein
MQCPRIESTVLEAWEPPKWRGRIKARIAITRDYEKKRTAWRLYSVTTMKNRWHGERRLSWKHKTAVLVKEI